MSLDKIIHWFDNDQAEAFSLDASPDYIDWWRVIPFIGMHVSCIFVVWVGWSWFAVVFAILMYAIRMFAITGFYHRYFSHKAFKTSRLAQAVFAIIGASAVQRGPLWWASHHRLHHARSDEPDDPHSPTQHGMLWSHTGWFLSNKHFKTIKHRVSELYHYPELRVLDRFDLIVPVAFALAIFILGALLDAYAPSLGTNGPQLLVWGFVISTVALYHATFTVNSLAHIWGRRRYDTKDTSRNNVFIAIITLGEGWHNNHHHYPGSARQGFYWWEVDLTYYLLKLLQAMGIIWDLKQVPAKIKDARKI